MRKLTRFGSIVTVLALSATVLAGCGSSAKEETETAGAKDPITGEVYPDQINIAVIEGGPESAMLVEEKLLSDENFGVKVNAVTYSSGTDVNNAFVSGDVDVASFGSSPIALGIANGIDYKVVYIPYIEGGNIEALAARTSLGATSVADLKGANIGVPFGTTSHYALLNALGYAGLSESDVTLYDMGGADIVAAYTRGDIDAAYIWSPALDELLGSDAAVITNDGELAEQGTIIPELAVASTEFGEKYPTLVQAYVKALTEVTALAADNQEQASKDIQTWEGVDEANATSLVTDNNWVSAEDQLTADYLGTTESVGKIAETLKTIGDFHEAQKNISKSPDLSEFESAIDSSYLEAVQK